MERNLRFKNPAAGDFNFCQMALVDSDSVSTHPLISVGCYYVAFFNVYDLSSEKKKYYHIHIYIFYIHIYIYICIYEV